MRVLMTADAVGGVWQYALQLCSLLTARGTEVLLATMGPLPSSQQRAEAAAIPGVTLHSSAFALEWQPHRWPEVDRAGEWLMALAAEWRPDRVHLNGYAHAALPWPAPVLLVAHSCVCSWWLAVHGTRPPREYDEYVRRVIAGLEAADGVVAPSAAMRDALVRCYGAGHQAEVIPNTREDAVRPAVKQPFVFAAGRVWDPAKNLSLLDRAVRDLSWPTYVAGDGAPPEGGPATPLRHLRPLGRLGARDVREWMARAAIYAFPARYEPFGLSVLEAALAGCALVLGDIASLRENWEGVARFVHVDRPAELRDALRQLIEAPVERAALGAAARQRALEFSPHRHAKAYDTVYRRMGATDDRTAHTARTHGRRRQLAGRAPA